MPIEKSRRPLADVDSGRDRAAKQNAAPSGIKHGGVVSQPGLPGIPMLATVAVEVCEPLDWSEFGPDDVRDPRVVDPCYEEITDSMQSILTRLAEEQPIPPLSRLASLVPSSHGVIG